MNKSYPVILSSLLLLGSIITWGNIPLNGNETAAPALLQSSNWQQIEGKGVTLSLPIVYEGGNPELDLDEIIAKIAAISPESSRKMNVIKSNATSIAFLAFDTSKKSSFITNVNIVQQSLPNSLTLEEYLDNSLQQLARFYQIQSSEMVSIGEYEGAKIIAQFQPEPTSIKQLFYLIPTNSTTFWIVTYTTTVEEFDQRLANFEASIQTFRGQ